MVEDVLAVLDGLGVGAQSGAGLSIGRMVALRAALGTQRVSGLILADTDAGSKPWNRLIRTLAWIVRGFGIGQCFPRSSTDVR
jgi:pimeloyl-ACP methyl ester carboxylesterase